MTISLASQGVSASISTADTNEWPHRKYILNAGIRSLRKQNSPFGGFRPYWREGAGRYVRQQIWPEQLRNMVNGLLMPVMAITAGSDIAVHAFQAALNVKSTCTVSYGNSILPSSV